MRDPTLDFPQLARFALTRNWVRRRYDTFFATCPDQQLFRGVFDTYDQALASAPATKPVSYDNAASSELYLQDLRAHAHDYPALFWIGQSFAEGMRTVFDVGGSVGIKYFAFSRLLPFPGDVRWIVQDMPAVVERGRRFAVGTAGTARPVVHAEPRGRRRRRRPVRLRRAAVPAADAGRAARRIEAPAPADRREHGGDPSAQVVLHAEQYRHGVLPVPRSGAWGVCARGDCKRATCCATTGRTPPSSSGFRSKRGSIWTATAAIASTGRDRPASTFRWKAFARQRASNGRPASRDPTACRSSCSRSPHSRRWPLA